MATCNGYRRTIEALLEEQRRATLKIWAFQEAHCILDYFDRTIVDAEEALKADRMKIHRRIRALHQEHAGSCECQSATRATSVE